MQGPAEPEIPHHTLVRALGGGRSWLLRSARGGALAVARRVGLPAEAARRRCALLSRAGGADAPLVVAAGGAVWALRPWIEGEPLDALLRDARVHAGRDAAALAEEVARLHRAGVAHGRIHPGNFVRSARGWALVDGVDPFRPPPAEGDPAVSYAAPEVLRGRGPSRRADLFSLALVVHAVHAGRGPLEGEAWSRAARAILHGEIAPLRAVAPEAPARVADAVARAMSPRPWRRSSAAALARALAGAAPRATAAADEVVAATPEVVAPRRFRAAGTPIVVRAEPRRTLLFPVAEASVNANATSGVPSPAEPSHPREPAPRRDELGAGSSATMGWRRFRHPSRRAALSAAAAALALAVSAGFLAQARRPPSFAREVDRLLDARDLDGARRALREAERRRPREPLVEKLRGDVACAERRYGECLRRYEAALAADRRLRADARMRQNALALLARADDRRALGAVLAQVAGVDDALAEAARGPRYWARWNAVRALEARGRADRVDYARAYALDLVSAASCETRRAAARELARRRDPRALPDLERAAAAARSSWSEWRCLGPEVDAALEATRAARVASR